MDVKRTVQLLSLNSRFLFLILLVLSTNIWTWIDDAKFGLGYNYIHGWFDNQNGALTGCKWECDPGADKGFACVQCDVGVACPLTELSPNAP